MNTAALPSIPRYRRWPAVLGSLAAFMLVLIVSCEAIGWPFLAEPIQRWLSDSLHRRVSFAIDGNTPASVGVRLFGRVRIEAPLIEIGPPAWSRSAHMLHASDAVISFHYADLWRAHRGEPLRIRMLEADELDADIEKLADGRASWQFGGVLASTQRGPRSFRLPLFDELKVRGGTLRWHDAMADLRMEIECRKPAPEDVVAKPVSSGARELAGLACHARGTWRREPVNLVLHSAAAMPWVNRNPAGERVPMEIDATVGDTHLAVRGTAIDVLSLAGINARFEAEGTSISTLAKALGVNLPPRAPFRATGGFTKEGQRWDMTLDRLELGTSELSGRFVLDRARTLPMLSGQLEGARLTWLDIGELPLPAPASDRQSVDMSEFRSLDAEVSVNVAQADFGDQSGRQPLRGTWRASKGRVSWVPSVPGAK